MVDFAELKTRINIEQTAQLLGLQLKQSGQAMRGPCPACDSGGERAIVITPAKNVFFCFAAKEGGDLIALAAHIRKCDVKDAAKWLDGGNSTSREPTKPSAPATLAPLDYIEHEHPAVQALGFEPEDAKVLGIGYVGKGIMKGLVVIPVRLENGTLAGYVGVDEIAKLPPRWHFGNVVPIKKTA